MQKHKDDNELVKLLNGRAAWKLPQAAPPYMDAKLLRRARDAVQCHMGLESSDPFAGVRISLHIRQGYELPSDVLKDCHKRKASYQTASIVAEVLAPVKRQLDADRAWNQHRAAQYLERKKAA